MFGHLVPSNMGDMEFAPSLHGELISRARPAGGEVQGAYGKRWTDRTRCAAAGAELFSGQGCNEDHSIPQHAPRRPCRAVVRPSPRDHRSMNGFELANTLDLAEGVGGPPRAAEVARVRDLLATHTDDGGTFEEFTAHPPAGDPPFELADGLTIAGNLDPPSLHRLIIASCMPRGHWFVPAVQFGLRHMFVREIELSAYQANPYHWDTDGLLFRACWLSRLVRDNIYSTRFAVRLVEFADGRYQVIPGPVDTESAFAYRSRHDRGWLDQADAAALRDLLTAYHANKDAFGPRLTAALRKCENASREHFIESTAVQIVGGLEALLNTGMNKATKQFNRRVPALATELGVEGMSRTKADRLYQLRSDEAHGREIQMFTSRPAPASDGAATTVEITPEVRDQRQQSVIADVALLQDTLRRAVRRAIEDADFRARFADEDSVRAQWPVPDPDSEGESL